jgi:hypothetical protein
MMVLWNIRWTTATIFYVLNIVTLLIPSIMILFKKKVDIASGILILNIIIQVNFSFKDIEKLFKLNFVSCLIKKLIFM